MLQLAATNGWDLAVAIFHYAGVVVVALLAYDVRRRVKTSSGDRLGDVAERTHDLASANAALLQKLNGKGRPAP